MIRLLAKNDLSNVKEIAQQNFTDELPSTNLLIDSFGEENYMFLGNFHNDVLASYLIALVSLDDVCITSIATKNEYKHKGYAKELILQLAKISAPKTLSLEVKDNNLPAINLYKSLGFKTLQTRKKYYKDGSSALCMFLLENKND